MLYYNPKHEIKLNRVGLLNVPTPQPFGPQHHPIPYGEFAELVINRLAAVADAEVVSDEYAVKKDGSQFFGLMEVRLSGAQNPDWSFQVGMRGSHDGSLSRELCFGTKVMVCSNLSFLGQFLLKTRHTTNVMDRLPRMVDTVLAKLPQAYQGVASRERDLRQLKLSSNDGDLFLVSLFRKQALSASQLAKALSEWADPSFANHTEDGFTGWRMLNSLTEAAKPRSEQANSSSHQQLTLDLNREVDVLLLS